MRIAYMLTSLGIGGAEKQVIAIGERMVARGHEVVLIVLRPAEEHECPTDLPTHRLGVTKSIPGIISGLSRASQLLRSFKPELLHSHTFPANMMARTLRSAGFAPLVLATIHNIYEGAWHRTLAYRITDSFCTHTTAISHRVAEHFIHIKAVPRNKCSVILNGIDVRTFSPPLPTDTASSETDRSSEPFIWLAAGRDVPAKDFDNLLVAFQIVRAAVPNAQLCIAGKPASHRTDMTGRGIQWLGISEDMPGTLAPCQAFVLSSAWEGMPLVVGEAMSMEKPFVATDVGGVSELAGGTGMIVPSKNPQALADAMLNTMRMPEPERCEMGRAARERIVQHFDVNAKADEWESLYSRILNCG
jgi:glycosyltransferase involved in cell wall biosynthesis